MMLVMLVGLHANIIPILRIALRYEFHILSKDSFNVSHAWFQFKGEGAGGMPEFIAFLSDDEIVWGAFKVVGVDDRGVTTTAILILNNSFKYMPYKKYLYRCIYVRMYSCKHRYINKIMDTCT